MRKNIDIVVDKDYTLNNILDSNLSKEAIQQNRNTGNIYLDDRFKKVYFKILTSCLTNNGGFLAGGVGRSFVCKKINQRVVRDYSSNYLLPDYDLYFKDSKTSLKASEEFLNALRFALEPFDFKIEKKNSIANNAVDILFCDKSLKPLVKFQFMIKFTGSVEDIFQQYDFENVQAALTCDGLVYNKRIEELERIENYKDNGKLSIFNDTSPCLLGRVKKYVRAKALEPTHHTMEVLESNLTKHITNQHESALQWLTKNPSRCIKELSVDDSAIVYTTSTLNSLIKYFSDQSLLLITPYFIMLNEINRKRGYKTTTEPITSTKIKNRVQNKNIFGADDVRVYEEKCESSGYPSNSVLDGI